MPVMHLGIDATLEAALSNPFLACAHQSPLFPLFLDATWQLLEQYPAAFEFSETYLAVLGDSTHISLFGTFLFNSPHQRVTQSTVSDTRPRPLQWRTLAVYLKCVI